VISEKIFKTMTQNWVLRHTQMKKLRHI